MVNFLLLFFDYRQTILCVRLIKLLHKDNKTISKSRLSCAKLNLLAIILWHFHASNLDETLSRLSGKKQWFYIRHYSDMFSRPRIANACRQCRDRALDSAAAMHIVYNSMAILMRCVLQMYRYKRRSITNIRTVRTTFSS